MDEREDQAEVERIIHEAELLEVQIERFRAEWATKAEVELVTRWLKQEAAEVLRVTFEEVRRGQRGRDPAALLQEVSDLAVERLDAWRAGVMKWPMRYQIEVARADLEGRPRPPLPH